MRNRRNYYRLLHVQPDAPLAVIRSSFRALMLHLDAHPDRGGDHGYAALLTEAYGVLSDAARREAYDRDLLAGGRDAAGGPLGRERTAAPPDGVPRRAGPTRAAGAAPRCVFCNSRTAEGGRRCPVCLSPLGSADEFASAGADQRSSLRVARQREITFYTDWPQSTPDRAVLQDVSPQGLRFVTPVPLRRYQVLKIDAGPLQATGHVAHTARDTGADAGWWTVGVRFFTVSLERGSMVCRSV